jgi:transposase
VTMIGAERPDAKAEVILGVDTHLEVHVAVAVDHLGRRLGELSVPTTAKGYERLLCWAEGFGPVRCAGIEGTSSYGVGLARHLKAAGISVMEVERPKRRHLRRNGKSDPETSPENARRIAGATPAENLAMFVARWPPCMGTAPPGGAQGVWAYGAHNLLA